LDLGPGTGDRRLPPLADLLERNDLPNGAGRNACATAGGCGSRLKGQRFALVENKRQRGLRLAASAEALHPHGHLLPPWRALRRSAGGRGCGGVCRRRGCGASFRCRGGPKWLPFSGITRRATTWGRPYIVRGGGGRPGFKLVGTPLAAVFVIVVGVTAARTVDHCCVIPRRMPCDRFPAVIHSLVKS
jgi:hypothetical protein